MTMSKVVTTWTFEYHNDPKPVTVQTVHKDVDAYNKAFSKAMQKLNPAHVVSNKYIQLTPFNEDPNAEELVVDLVISLDELKAVRTKCRVIEEVPKIEGSR
nr:MAG TPA: hypothetical protein [Caudoviricetes sp.]